MIVALTKVRPTCVLVQLYGRALCKAIILFYLSRLQQ